MLVYAFLYRFDEERMFVEHLSFETMLLGKALAGRFFQRQQRSEVAAFVANHHGLGNKLNVL